MLGPLLAFIVFASLQRCVLSRRNTPSPALWFCLHTSLGDSLNHRASTLFFRIPSGNIYVHFWFSVPAVDSSTVCWLIKFCWCELQEKVFRNQTRGCSRSVSLQRCTPILAHRNTSLQLANCCCLKSPKDSSLFPSPYFFFPLFLPLSSTWIMPKSSNLEES